MDDFEFQLQAEQKSALGPVAGPSLEENTRVDPTDGTVYVWDQEKRAWFPKITDDFIAAYQASYGVVEEGGEEKGKEDSIKATSDGGISSNPAPTPMVAPEEPMENTQSTETEKSVKGNEQQKSGNKDSDAKKRKAGDPPGWFDMDENRNSWVYVSGLPLDITEDEFTELMSKYGIIMETDEGKKKIKLYKDINGELKGDGSCCYLKVESVKLVIDLLNDSTYKEKTISVEKAHFQMKGSSYNPSLKKKKPNKKKKKGFQAKLLDWRERPDPEAEGGTAPVVRKKNERVVILKNMFDPKEFDEHPEALNDIRDDVKEECGKFGTLKKILIFDRHPEGIVSLAYKEYEGADMCVSRMNGRFYGGHLVEAAHWDGLTNFEVEETQGERDQRLDKWHQFIGDNQPEPKQEAASQKTEN